MTIHSAKFDINNNVQVEIPSEVCCNCGSTNGLKPIPTELKETRYMVLGGTEITLNLNFPYCGNCTETAKRRPVGVGAKMLISSVLFFALMIGWIFVPSSISGVIPTGAVLPILFCISCAVIFGFYSLKKPNGTQTSYYQPVRMKKIKQKFSGEIVGYIIAFTNEIYKRKFVSANCDAVSKKVIEVVTA